MSLYEKLKILPASKHVEKSSYDELIERIELFAKETGKYSMEIAADEVNHDDMLKLEKEDGISVHIRQDEEGNCFLFHWIINWF